MKHSRTLVIVLLMALIVTALGGWDNQSAVMTVENGCENEMTGRMNVLATALKAGHYTLTHESGSQSIELGQLKKMETAQVSTALTGNWFVIRNGQVNGYVTIEPTGTCEKQALPAYLDTWDM